MKLDEAQKSLHKNPSCPLLREEEAHYFLAFKNALLDEEWFLRQKSKVEWLRVGDSNSAYFHNVVKGKCVRNHIEMVRDSSNVLHEGNDVVGVFVNHYENFLGLKGSTIQLANQDLFTRVLDVDMDDSMVRDVTDSEIKAAMFSVGGDKAPGPDGYTAAFLKKPWDVVGGDVTCAVRDFFSNGKLLSSLKSLTILL